MTRKPGVCTPEAVRQASRPALCRAPSWPVCTTARSASSASALNSIFLCDAVGVLVGIDDAVEAIPVEAVEHAPYLKEAPIGVPCGPAEAFPPGETLGYRLVDPDVEKGVHHAGQRDGGPAPYRKQERVLRVPEFAAGQLFEPGDLSCDPQADILEDVLIAHHGVKAAKDLGGDDETRRDGEPHGHELLEEVSLVPDQDLVVHLLIRPVEGGYGQLRLVGHDYVENPFIVLEFLQLGAQRPDYVVDKGVHHLQAEGGGDDGPYEVLGKLVYHLFVDHAAGRARGAAPLDLADDEGEVRAVHVDIVVPDDILDALRNEPEDVEVLVHGKLFHLEGRRDVFDLHHQPFGCQSFQIECLYIEPEALVYLCKGAPRDELEVERLLESLEKDGREALQPQRKADCLEFLFPVGPVHGRDPRGDVPLIVDILRIMGLVRGEDFLA